MRIFFDIDGTLAEWKAAATPEELMSKGYFINLSPQQNVVDAVKILVATKGVEVFILSAYLHDSKYARDEKVAWCKKHIPEVPNSNLIFVPYGEKKENFVPDGIRSDDVLFDDYSSNLHEWGGIAIKCKNQVNGRKGTWKKGNISIKESPCAIASGILSISKEKGEVNGDF